MTAKEMNANVTNDMLIARAAADLPKSNASWVASTPPFRSVNVSASPSVSNYYAASLINSSGGQ